MKNQYKINEFGEIVSEDYFFSQVKGTGVQILPFQRKAWKILILNIITLGIYGLVIGFAMVKETNIACSEDGKHTKGFWPVFGLAIVTLGIYFIVWYIKWINREAAFLKSKNIDGSFSGVLYLILVLLSLIPYVGLITNFIILSCIVNQHNIVNAKYNEMNNFIQKI